MSKKIKNEDDYWVGGRSVGPVYTAVSYCASYYSTVAIVGAVPLYYMYGLGYHSLEMLGSTFFTGIVIFAVVGMKMRCISEQRNVVSLPGFLASRFQSNLLRLISALLIACMMIPYAVSVLKGIADAMSAIAGFPYVVGVVMLALVALFYLVSSGYWGVAVTDLIQGITIALAVLVLAAICLWKGGGLTNIIMTVQKQDASLLSVPGPLSFGQIFSYAWVWALIAFGQPQLVTKFMGLKDGRTIGTVIRTSVIWMAVFATATGIIGMAARVFYANGLDSNIDLLAPKLALEYGGTVVSGLFMCGAIAAGLSTLVALVLSSSTAICKDILEDWRAEQGKGAEKNAVRNSRIVTAVIFVLSIALAIKPWDFVWSMSTMAAGVMGAAFTAPMMLGLYWKRATREGGVAAVVGGASVSLIWYIMGLSDIVHSFVPGTIASFVLMVLVSLVTNPLPQEHVALFFETDKKAVKENDKDGYMDNMPFEERIGS